MRSGLMRPLLACVPRASRATRVHEYTGTDTGVIKLYCTSDAGSKLLDKEWLNYCLMIKDFTAFSSAVWLIHLLLHLSSTSHPPPSPPPSPPLIHLLLHLLLHLSSMFFFPFHHVSSPLLLLPSSPVWMYLTSVFFT